MGKTIKINTETLNGLLEKLNDKKGELTSYSPTKCVKKGSGSSADKLEEIEALYDEMKNAIVDLYDKTISYMQGLSQQADETDSGISESMNLGG